MEIEQQQTKMMIYSVWYASVNKDDIVKRHDTKKTSRKQETMLQKNIRKKTQHTGNNNKLQVDLIEQMFVNK